MSMHSPWKFLLLRVGTKIGPKKIATWMDAFAFQGISNVTDITNFIPLSRFRCAQSYQFCDFCSVNEDTIFKKIRTGKSTLHCHFLRRSKILRRPRSGRQAANCALPRVTGEYGGSWA